MNGISQVGVPLSIEVNYDSGLFVGMTVYDDSGSSPVQVGGVIPMLNVVDTLYRAQFTPTAQKNYIFRKAVYTDNTYTTLNTSYARASEAVQVVDLAALASRGSDITGLIDENPELVGGAC